MRKSLEQVHAVNGMRNPGPGKWAPCLRGRKEASHTAMRIAKSSGQAHAGSTPAGGTAKAKGNKIMTFGDAIEAVKQGKRAWRKGWHGVQSGKSMCIFLIDLSGFTARISSEYTLGAMNPCIALAVNGNVQPGWLASQPDMLSDDWQAE